MIGEYLKSLRLNRGLSMEEVSEGIKKLYPDEAKISRGNISRWERNEIDPSLTSIRMLSEFYGVTLDDIVKGNDNYRSHIKSLGEINVLLSDEMRAKLLDYAKQLLKEQSLKNMFLLKDYIEEPLYGYVSAGLGTEVFDDPVELVTIPSEILPDRPYDMMLQVRGDSMTPLFKDGEYIFVVKTKEIRSGQIGVFMLGSESFVKKAYISDDQLTLVSLNKSYKDIVVNSDHDISVVGVVLF